MPDSQRGSLCTRSEVSDFESVEADKEGISSSNASDESYEHENSKIAETIGWTNDPASWSRVMNRNVKGLFYPNRTIHNYNRVFASFESDRTVLVSLQKSTAKWWNGTSSIQGRIQPVSLGGAISVIFGSQVSVGSQVSFRIVQNHGEQS